LLARSLADGFINAAWLCARRGQRINHSRGVFYLKRRDFLRVGVGSLALSGLRATNGQETHTETRRARCPRRRDLFDADWRFHLVGATASEKIEHPVPINNWLWKTGTPDQSASILDPDSDISSSGWKPAQAGAAQIQEPGYAWFRATLPPCRAANRVLRFKQIDANGTVYLNGKRLYYHQGWRYSFDVPLDSAWRTGKANVVVVLVHNTLGVGGITGPVTFGQLPQVSVTPFSSPELNDQSWGQVHLPHDYVIEGRYDFKLPHGSLPLSPAWYRKHFHLAKSDQHRSIWITFDAVYKFTKVYLNGHYLGEHDGGYTPFRFDIGRYANFGGENVLAVHVDPRCPQHGWYEGGGIYRHVWLNVADRLHVAPWGVYVTSAVHNVRNNPWAELSLQTKVVNEGNMDRTCEVVSHVFDPTGRMVATQSHPLAVPAGKAAECRQGVTLRQALLWSLESRNLYRLVTEIYRDGVLIDTHEQRFGIRTIRFQADNGFFLNEKRVELKGTCNHQDFVGVGIAAPDSLWYWRVRKLREIGCNAIRCSHNLMAPAFYDACDRLGVLVMDENRRLSDSFAAKTSLGDCYKNAWHIDEMVLQDRNHPSVVIWSLCNEEWMIQNSKWGEKVFDYAIQSVRKFDRTRPITCAMNSDWAGGPASGWNAEFSRLRGFSVVENLQGCNYGSNDYDRWHVAFPSHPMFASEMGNNASVRGIYHDAPARGYVSAYSGDPEGAWHPVAARRFMAGGFVWTGFDYRGGCNAPAVNASFGILDTCGFPKDNAMYYKAWWNRHPLVHIFPHWNWLGQEGKAIRVWCYSNCDEVELLVNGQSFGRQAMRRFSHLQWMVPYQPGRIVGVGYKNGAVVASHLIQTTGEPAALRLIPDRTVLEADGEDIVPVAVAVIDSAGRTVPTADNKVLFRVTGPGENAGVGNGDPSCHEPTKADYRRAFNGLCMVLVRAKNRTGRIVLEARAAGLRPDGVVINSESVVVDGHRGNSASH
jgi:beta-galactosidase